MVLGRARSWQLVLASGVILAAPLSAQNENRIESTVKRLAAKLDEIESYLQSLDNGATDQTMTAAEASAAAKLSQLEQRTVELSRQLAEAQSTIQDATRRARDLEHTTGQLSAQLAAARDELRAAAQREIELVAAAARQREAFDEMQATAETIRSRNAGLAEHLAAAERELRSALEERDRLLAEARQASPQSAPGHAPNLDGDIHVHNDGGTVILQIGGGRVGLDRLATEELDASSAHASPMAPKPPDMPAPASTPHTAAPARESKSGTGAGREPRINV
jgi:hypothetical protein